MTCRILIVEDQPLIAMTLEDAVLELGYEMAGIAATKSDALKLGQSADVALVDVYLNDGPTGPEIGRTLASEHVSVLFMTGNPECLGDGIPGTLGVIAKPLMSPEVIEAIQYAAEKHATGAALAPRRLVQFA